MFSLLFSLVSSEIYQCTQFGFQTVPLNGALTIVFMKPEYIEADHIIIISNHNSFTLPNGQTLVPVYRNIPNITVSSTTETSVSFSITRFARRGPYRCDKLNIVKDKVASYMIEASAFNKLKTNCVIFHFAQPTTFKYKKTEEAGSNQLLVYEGTNVDTYSTPTKIIQANTYVTYTGNILLILCNITVGARSYARMGVSEMTCTNDRLLRDGDWIRLNAYPYSYVEYNRYIHTAWPNHNPFSDITVKTGYGSVDVGPAVRTMRFNWPCYVVFLDDTSKMAAKAKNFYESAYRDIFNSTKIQGFLFTKNGTIEILSDVYANIRYAVFKIDYFSSFYKMDVITLLGNVGKMEIRPLQKTDYEIFAIPLNGKFTFSCGNEKDFISMKNVNDTFMKNQRYIETDQPIRVSISSNKLQIFNISQIVPEKENQINYAMRNANTEYLAYNSLYRRICNGWCGNGDNPNATYEGLPDTIYQTPTPTMRPEDPNGGGNSKRTIMIVSFIVIVIAVAICLTVYLIVKKNKSKIKSSSSSSSSKHKNKLTIIPANNSQTVSQSSLLANPYQQQGQQYYPPQNQSQQYYPQQNQGAPYYPPPNQGEQYYPPPNQSIEPTYPAPYNP